MQAQNTKYNERIESQIAQPAFGPKSFKHKISGKSGHQVWNYFNDFPSSILFS